MGNGKVPGYSPEQFSKEYYKNSDYGTLMDKYEKHHIMAEKMVKNADWNKKKAKLRKWTEADQLFEDMLWVS